MKRVLVVEDEASIREMVALNLKMAGWEVVEASSAERALELMHHGETCDAALLDIMLPGMDGLSLCETIRRENNEIGIIIVSAKGQESDKIRGLSIGADDYITKPFSVSELVALFFRNPGTALVREKILEGVWGKNYFGYVKIVDVNIRRLRMKIEDEPSSPQHILTVWGYGYRWNG